MGAPMVTHTLFNQTDFLNWKINPPLPESLFQPPKGMAFEEARKAPAGPTLVPGRPPRR
jgi:hypothetical protein